MRQLRAIVWFAVLAAGAAGGISRGDEPANDSRTPAIWPGMTRAGSVLLPNGWSLRPAGRQSPLGDLPVLLALHPSEPIVAVLHAGYGEHEVVTCNAENGKVIGRVALHQSFSGLVWSRDGKRLYAGGGFDDVVYGFDHADGLLANPVKLTFSAPSKGQPDEGKPQPRLPAGLALSRDGRTLWFACAFSHTLARFDTAERQQKGEIALGTQTYPYGLVWDESRDRLYVSLWGNAEVAVVDTAARQVVCRWKTDEHPNEMLLARQGKLLYVANANRNTVSVIATETGQPLETIGTAIDPRAPSGSTPSALALTPDESMLFVANANTNHLTVVNVKEPGESRPLGFIPTGWYPTSVRVARDGQTLYVANGKGGSSRANRDGPNPLVPGGTDNKLRQYIGGLFQGTLAIIPMPSPGQMGRYSQTVYDCSPLKKDDPTAVTGAKPAAGNPIPTRVGDPSPITHCVYIIKENRTYDQVFGDLPQGNGEASLCLFPEEVTPNHHALVREFVLLDNFYVESEVSADGHEWSMGAYATDYVERTWPLGYRGEKKAPYPAEGNKEVYAIARPAGGYIWDQAAARGVSYRSYGEFVKNGPTPDSPCTTVVQALEGHFDPMFRSFDMDYSDLRRADRFLEELAGFEQSGTMPRLVILRLPNDHTSGTSPGKLTPTAFVAENDLALGRVVEALTRSRFWKGMAIFVVEDDAQNGSDHVDAHRTVALAISPYIKRGSVDSTLYSTSSMLRTMELCLGLDPMSQFDAAARPMSPAFTSTPDLTPYTHRPARVDLNARNLRTAWGAERSLRLNLEVEDRADDLVFNEIIWKSVKGAASPMPPPVRAAFVMPRRERETGRDEDD
jgi:DNA-binding beta-propeller fold protein YncE